MKFETPKMEIAKFAFENVVTTSGVENSATYDTAEKALEGSGVNSANVVTVIL